MNVALKASGRKFDFSKEELEELKAILEEYFSSKTTEQVEGPAKVVKRPTEEEWFLVNPTEINWELFEDEREDPHQEATRQIILEARSVTKENPEKYGKPFETKMIKKNWIGYLCSSIVEKKASHFGDHIIDWVEKALQWAQRLTNGETWEALCNDKDFTEWYQLVKWKDGKIVVVGSSKRDSNDSSATNIFQYKVYDYRMELAVPEAVREVA